MDITCLRLFTVYGPRQRPDLAIHKFTRLIESGMKLPLFGDGSMERDYTYIGDIIDGIVSAIDTNEASGYRVINLGSDNPIRLDGMLSAIERALNKKAMISKKPVPPGDVRRTWADLSVARRELDYSHPTPFEVGIQNFLDWLRCNNRKVVVPIKPEESRSILKCEIM